MIVIIDTREQSPWDFPVDVARVREGLCTGDYSIRGLEGIVRIERKSIDDLAACCGRERDRFERELLRLRAFPRRAVVVEGSEDDIRHGRYASKIEPRSVLASIAAWASRYAVPFHLSTDAAAAAHYALDFLSAAARDAERVCRHFAEVNDHAITGSSGRRAEKRSGNGGRSRGNNGRFQKHRNAPARRDRAG